MDVFLQLNGYELTAADSPETLATIRALAAGELAEDQLAAWVTTHCKPITL
jgi:prophage maintenance system killer protein